MALEYEIKEVGFIGSLWQGDFNTPINVGKTVEVINVPNTINSGRNQSIFLTTKENVDIDKLTRQLPDVEYYYETGRLSSQTLDDLATYTKVDRNFLAGLDVLYRYTKRAPYKDVNASSLPIQENWSFDESDPNNPVYIYNRPEYITYVQYVFLVSEQYQKTLTDYFLTIQQVETIFEPPVVATPPSEIKPSFSAVVPSTVMPPPPPIFTGNVFTPPVIDPAEIERLAILRFENALEIANSDVPVEQKNELLIANTTEDVNKNLKVAENRINFIIQMMDQMALQSQGIFSTKTPMQIELIFLSLIRNYLFDRLRQINDAGFPEEDPNRYSVTSEGNIVVLPKPVEQPTPEALIIQNEINQEQSDFDEFIDEIIEDLETDENNVYAFKKISKISDYDLPILCYKTKGLFRCTGEKLSTFYTGSLTPKQKTYYLSVFNEQQYTTDSYHQFDVTYCHISGSGSSYIQGEVDLYPAKSMYRKYMLECFGNTEGKFPFKNGKNGDYFYAIQLDRDSYKEKLDAGNFEIALCELSSSGAVMHPSSSKLFTLIDESKDTKQEIVTNEGIQEYYYVTSGSLRDGVYNESSDDAWGIVFPKMGLIILDGVVLDQSCSFNTATSSIDGQNSNRLFLSISGAAVPTSYRPSSSFFARSFETHLTETYFCRADFNEFNYSTNYTYVKDNDGFLKYDYFKKDPHTYITTIGLYNRKKELLAVGKLRNPIQKNDGKVCIFEVVVRLN